MKCPKCGFVSYNYLNACKRCGYDLASYKAKLGIAHETAEPEPAPAPSAASDPAVGPHGQLFDRLQSDYQRKKEETRRHKEEERLHREQEEQRARAEEERQRREREEAALRETARIEAERVAREEAQRLREVSEREIQKQVAQAMERAEREARERAEIAAREAERRAREEAEVLRREAQREAEKLRQAAQREARRILLEAEKQAVDTAAHARSIGAAEAAKDRDDAPLAVPARESVPEEWVRDQFADAGPVKDVPTADAFLARLSEDELPDGELDDATPNRGAGLFPLDAALEDVEHEEVVEQEEEVTDRFTVRSVLPENVERGGLTVRMAAAFLDCSLLAIILGGFILIGIGAFSMGDKPLGTVGLLRLAGPIYLLLLLIGTCYYTLFLGSSGQTPGMMVFGLKVMSADGDGIGYGRAFIRLAATVPSVGMAGLGLLAIPFHADRQAWHDRIAQCIVVRL